MSSPGSSATPAVKKSRSWLLWTILVAVGVVVLSVITYKMVTYKPEKKSEASPTQASVPLASAPLSTWSKLTLPPLEKLKLPTPQPGMHAMVNGDKLRVHTVYADGHECIRASEGEGSDVICPDGATEVYVSNVRNEANTVLYAYESKQ